MTALESPTASEQMSTPSILQKNISDSQALLKLLLQFEPQVEAAAQLVAAALLSGKKLLACGNGGSAADASHLTTEFVVRFVNDRDPYPAISLNANGGDLTAIGNDYSYAETFARQVHAYGQPGDILFALTTSGNSENVRRALLAARERGLHSIALLGRDGGACCSLATVEIVVPHTITARIQEAHKLLIHTVCEIVEQRLQAHQNGRPSCSIARIS